MGRSLGFGSTAFNLDRPIQTRFRYGFSGFIRINLAKYSNSPVHYAKGTQSAIPHLGRGIGLLPLVSIWFQVLFHSPYRGSFQLSFTLLVRYRSRISI